MKKLLAVALTFVCVTSAHAEWTNVFCSKPDGSHWDWLEDDGDNQVTISGQWGESTSSDGSIFFKRFSVSLENYLSVNDQCKTKFSSEYIAQPADSSSDNWHIFMVSKPNGEQYLAPGKYMACTTLRTFRRVRTCENVVSN